MKKALCFSILCSSLAFSAHAEKLAIVIDDSSGMCGYLDAPIEKNAYKKALQVLLRARDASNLDVHAYYLSNLNQAMSVGATLDKIISANRGTCPFTATTSPLHQGLDLQKVKADAVIMVTDLLFDEGGAGSSDSRAALINQFDYLASQPKNAKQWFETSAGIIGVKSDFKGTYYSIQGQGKTDFLAQSVERPFYWLWLSKTPKFFPYLEQLNHVWKTVNPVNKKLMVEGVYTLRLLPVTELVSRKKGLFLKPVQNSLTDQHLAVPQIYYGKGSNKNVLDEILSLDYSGKYPIPAECFKTTANPLLIQFYASCANAGRNKTALFEHKHFPNSIMLSYPLNNVSSSLQRSFQVTTSDNGFFHPVEAFYRTSKQSQVLSQYKGQYPASLVLHIQNLRSSRSILFNSPSVKEKQLQLNVIENYQANTQDNSFISVAKQYWSDIKEPCLQQSVECQKANTSTYQVESLLSSLVTRLDANQRAASLLNQDSQPTQINIVLDQNK